MRYGGQPWTDLMNMDLDDLYAIANELLEIVNEENERGSPQE